MENSPQKSFGPPFWRFMKWWGILALMMSGISWMLCALLVPKAAQSVPELMLLPYLLGGFMSLTLAPMLAPIFAQEPRHIPPELDNALRFVLGSFFYDKNKPYISTKRLVELAALFAFSHGKEGSDVEYIRTILLYQKYD
jgi:hypothetical protein